MTYHAQFQNGKSGLEGLRSEAAPRNPGALALLEAMASIGRRIAHLIDTAADYCAAASIYEQLSRLSDAELNRRGLSRDTLARDIVESRWMDATAQSTGCERSGAPGTQCCERQRPAARRRF
jgi:hypothetical protein